MYTKQQLITALLNLQWMIKEYKHSEGDGATFYADVETLAYGSGGVHLDVLVEEGFTPATREQST